MSGSDQRNAAIDRGELLSRWRIDLANWPSPALLLDDDLTVIAINDAAAAQAVQPGTPLGANLEALATPSQPPRQRWPAGASLHFFRVEADDFSGWFVDTAAAVARDGQTETVIARRLADSNLKLQDEIRRRRFLERQVLSVAEIENRRISMELHDGLGQHLTGVAFLARSLADGLKSEGHPRSADAEWLVRLVNESVGKTRALSRGLWPVSLERGSMRESLDRLAADIEAIYGVSCAVQVVHEPAIASTIAAHHLFRVMQEAATNAIKHGRARRLTFRLEAVGDDFVASVTNDGLPLPADALSADRGIGVVGMRLRADALGGELSIEPLETGGAEVTVTLPGVKGKAEPAR